MGRIRVIIFIKTNHKLHVAFVSVSAFCTCPIDTVILYKYISIKIVSLPSFKVNLPRHTGQFNSSSRFPSTKFSKHFLQNECRHGSVRGSSNVTRQIEHSSKSFKSWSVGGILLAEAILNENGLVVWRKGTQNEYKLASNVRWSIAVR